MTDRPLAQVAYANHDRRWRDNVYVYAVLSRRSHGLSIGINLNPDKACNFDCIYCEVDRKTPPRIRDVDLDRLRDELDVVLAAAADGRLFTVPPLDHVPVDRRAVRDIAFSGDGEPTTCPRFDEAVQVAADARRRAGLHDAKLVLITDACYLTKSKVRAGLEILDRNNGEIWAKLDAGTEDYYRLVNRPNVPLQHVLDNILDAARARPVIIQSLWMRVHGRPPPNEEIVAYCDRLADLLARGARFSLIQTYTIARPTPEPYATPLADGELDAIADVVRARLPVAVETYYATGA
ncbi:MAG: radical SAM protein [Phycisphaerae bacterium]|nr:radical SAM protein [Phycisphaerae bacterium]